MSDGTRKASEAAKDRTIRTGRQGGAPTRRVVAGRGERWTSIAHVAAMGLLFALVQSGLFFQLQLRLTAAYPSFLTVTLAWLIGSLVGLWVGRRKPGSTGFLAWMAASLVGYYLVMVLLRRFPYTIELLPVMGLLIVMCGVQAGHFFGANRSLFDSSASLFFWENNGFLLGWIVGYAGYVRFGNAFHWASPALAGLLALGLLGPRLGRASTRLSSPRAEGSPA